MKNSLSIQEARKLVLLSQRLPSSKFVGPAPAATLSAIEHLGYIQIDTLSVIQRAHHHTIWNRHPRYQASQLDRLLADKRVFEYWSHAAAYLPMRDFRFSLPRKRAMACGDQEHWYARDAKLEQLVMKRIHDEGPLMARDFEGNSRRRGDWHAKPAKRTLENLFMQGKLMSPRRVNFQKVYDLTQRVLPQGIDLSMPSRQLHARFLITRYLRANGLGQPAECCYLLKDTRSSVAEALAEMVLGGEVKAIRVEGDLYHALPASLEQLNHRLTSSPLKILSPFDNLVIQRKRIKKLFGFDYQIECYRPAAKRRYGYFTLPLLWNGRLVARMDCKASRKESLMHLHHLVLEPWMTRTDGFLQALSRALRGFMKFNQCHRLRIHKTSPHPLADALRALMSDCDVSTTAPIETRIKKTGVCVSIDSR